MVPGVPKSRILEPPDQELLITPVPFLKKEFPETTAEFSISILKLHNSPNLFSSNFFFLGGGGDPDHVRLQLSKHL